jgi:cleavage and polyadenylation specificity factor subunit 3
MLQSGVSRQLFDRWASDPKNGCLIAGYAVEHTLAKEIMSQPREVVTMEGRRQPLNCLVDYVSFSAHVDFVQNRDFITTVNPRNIVLVHGAKEEMGRLKGALMMHYNKLPEKHRPTIAMPPNEVEVKLIFTRRRSATILGKLAAAASIDLDNVNNNDDDVVTTAKEEEEVMVLAEPREGDPVRGILVTQQNSSRIVAPEDLSTYTPLRVGSVSSRLHVPFVGKIATLRMFLNQMFRGISESREGDNDDDNYRQEEVVGDAYVDDECLGDIVTFSMHGGQVKVIAGKTRGVVTVEWDCSPVGDVIADSVVALIMHAQSSAASIRLTSQPCNHRRKKQREGIDETVDEDRKKDEAEVFLRALHQALKDQFLFVEATYEANKGTFEVRIDANTVKGGKEGGEDNDDNNEEDVDSGIICVAIVEFNDGFDGTAKITVESEDEKLASNIRACLQNVATASAPIALD